MPRLSSLTLHLDSKAGHGGLLGRLALADCPELSRLDLDLIKADDPRKVELSVILMLSTMWTLRTVVGTAELEEMVKRWKKRTLSFLPRLVSLRVRDRKERRIRTE